MNAMSGSCILRGVAPGKRVRFSSIAQLTSLPMVRSGHWREIENIRLLEVTHRFVSHTFSAVWSPPFSKGRAIISP